MNIGNKALIVLSFLIVSCSQLPEKKEITPNPTAYIFESDKASLKKAIIEEMGDLKYNSMMLYYQEGPLPLLDSLTFFDQNGNADDFYLAPTFIWIGKSYTYPELNYVASFHLHLIEIDNDRMQVVVNTVRPQVILGKEFWPSFPHFSRDYKYSNVPPSTVEEYEILFRIGKALNQNMPEVIYP